MRRLLAFAFLAVPAMSQAIVIDDFTVPYTRTISEGTWVDYQTDASLFTGERDVMTEIPMLSAGDATVTIGNGRMSLTNTPQSRLWAYLQYDGIGDEAGNTGADRELTYATNPGHPFPDGARTIRFHVESSVLDTVVGVQLVRQGEVLYTNSRTVTAGGPRVLDIVAAPSIFEECDSMTVRVLATRLGASVTLTKIEVVPEVNPGLILTAGALAVGLRARRKAASGEVQAPGTP